MFVLIHSFKFRDQMLKIIFKKFKISVENLYKLNKLYNQKPQKQYLYKEIKWI